MLALMRHLLTGDLPPEFFAVLAIEAEYNKLIVVGRWFRLCLFVGAWGCFCDAIGLDRRDNEDLILPDDRCCAAFAW